METEQLFAYAFVALAFVLVIFGLPFVYYVLKLTNQNVAPEVVESMFAKFQEAVINAAREAVERTPNTLDNTLLDIVAPKKPLIPPALKERIEAPSEAVG